MSTPKWINGCQLCNDGIVQEIEELKKVTGSVNAACKKMAAEAADAFPEMSDEFSTSKIRHRYDYHMRRKDCGNSTIQKQLKADKIKSQSSDNPAKSKKKRAKKSTSPSIKTSKSTSTGEQTTPDVSTWWPLPRAKSRSTVFNSRLRGGILSGEANENSVSVGTHETRY